MRRGSSSKSLEGARRSRRRLVESIQKLSCTLPVCKEVEASQQHQQLPCEMMTAGDENPYYFPVAFPEIFGDEIPLKETHHEESSSSRSEKEDAQTQTQPKQQQEAYRIPTPPREIKNPRPGSSLSSSAGAPKVTRPTRTASPVICPPPILKRELVQELAFDDERYTYSPELSLPVEPVEDVKVEQLRSFDKDPGIDQNMQQDPPIGRIQTDESNGGVPMIIQFAIGAHDDGSNATDDFYHQQNFHPVYSDAVEMQSTRTPRGHRQEEDNDSSRDQPSLSSKRSLTHSQSSGRRLGTSNIYRRGPSYATSGSCATPTSPHYSPTISSVHNNNQSSSPSVNNFHFEFEEPSTHRCFKMKSSPGDLKPRYLCSSSARQKMTLSDKLEEELAHTPVAVRHKAHPSISSNTTTRSGATVATTQSTSSVGSRASSSGMRVLDLIQRYDRHSVRDLGLNSSSCDGNSTTRSVPSILKEDTAAFDSCYDFRQAPAMPPPVPLSHLTLNHHHHPEVYNMGASGTVGIVDTSFNTSLDSYYYGDNHQQRVYQD